MAKNNKNGGGSKVRFIMLEADIADGDFSQITTAISNALKPQGVRHTAVLTTGTDIHRDEPVDIDASIDHDEPGAEPAPRPRANRTRKPSYRTPEVVTDLDLKGEVPFEKFAKEKAPKSDLKRHLVAACWLKSYRNILTISADHAYTCYKQASWSTGILDFSQPFRDLDRQGLGKAKAGAFTINHIGEDKVDKMGSSGGDE